MMLSINAEAGIIPSSSGIEMPSAEFAIGKRPISDTTVNDVRIQVYTPFSESDCNAFSQYLANWGCLLGKSDTVNGIFTAEIEYDAYKIVFSYEKATQNARIEYPAGTKPEDSKSYAKVQKNGILPTYNEMFNVLFPTPSNVFNRTPLTLREDYESKQYTYTNVAVKDYEDFGRYLAEYGCVLGNNSTVGYTTRCELYKRGATFELIYDAKNLLLTLKYPRNASVDLTIAQKNTDDLPDTILPNPVLLNGVKMPSLTVITNQFPSITEYRKDGSCKVTFENITESVFNRFDELLEKDGCKLSDYSTSGNELTAVIEKQGAQFTVAYNSISMMCEIEYPAGTYEDDSEVTFRNCFKPGDYIFFGAYEQDNDLENGSEPIEWVILSTSLSASGSRLELISRFILDVQPYQSTGDEPDWENSDIRKWMIETFAVGFTAKEKKMISSSFDLPSKYDADKSYVKKDNGKATDYALSKQKVTSWWLPFEVDYSANPTWIYDSYYYDCAKNDVEKESMKVSVVFASGAYRRGDFVNKILKKEKGIRPVVTINIVADYANTPSQRNEKPISQRERNSDADATKDKSNGVGYVVIQSGTNIREKPAANSKNIAYIDKECKCVYYSIEDGWYYIELSDGRKGYVYNSRCKEV